MEDEEVQHSTNDLAADINSKIDELSKSIDKLYGKKKEYTESKINENPIAYMAGAFVGGVIVGYLIARGKG